MKELLKSKEFCLLIDSFGVCTDIKINDDGQLDQVTITNSGNPYYNQNTIIKQGVNKPKIFAGIGSRETPAKILLEITKFARLMAEKGWILRSGGAEGADAAFEAGYVEFPGQKEIYLPWPRFNNNPSPLHTISNEAMMMAKQFHPAWHNVKNPAAQKLLARNTYQILGFDCKTPCDLVVCWTEEAKITGGTGQALRIAKAFNIRIKNLADIKVGDDKASIPQSD